MISFEQLPPYIHIVHLLSACVCRFGGQFSPTLEELNRTHFSLFHMLNILDAFATTRTLTTHIWVHTQSYPLAWPLTISLSISLLLCRYLCYTQNCNKLKRSNFWSTLLKQCLHLTTIWLPLHIVTTAQQESPSTIRKWVKRIQITDSSHSFYILWWVSCVSAHSKMFIWNTIGLSIRLKCNAFSDLLHFN